MKHNIRLPDGTIQTLDCEFGSGKFDKNGREIFEGDILKSCYSDTYPEYNTYVDLVVFRWAMFDLIRQENHTVWKNCGGEPLGWHKTEKNSEVIGHEEVTDENHT